MLVHINYCNGPVWARFLRYVQRQRHAWRGEGVLAIFFRAGDSSEWMELWGSCK